MIDPAKPEEGIFPDTPEPIYRSARAISQSELQECEYSMAHFQQARTSPRKPPTWDQIIGTLTHALILQRRQLFVIPPIGAPKRPTKAQMNAKESSVPEAVLWWKQFIAANPGKEIIDAEEAENLFGMRNSVMRHPEASEMIARATAVECAGFKRHPSGVMMKARADCLCIDDNQFTTVPDLKTVQRGGAKLEMFRKSIDNWSYYIQAPYYLDVFGATYFVFIVVEKEPPYAVACYNLDYEALRIGRMKIDGWLNEIARCEASGVWPAYHTGIASIGLPEWAKRRES